MKESLLRVKVVGEVDAKKWYLLFQVPSHIDSI